MKGRISETLAASAITAIVAAIATIRENLKFLVALSPEQRKTMLKLGPKSARFVADVRKLAAAHPELVPSAIDFPEFAKDADMIEVLGQFQPELTQVSEAVEDTLMVAGSEALSSALVLYGILQSSARAIPGLDDTMKELGKRFRRGPRKGTAENPAA